MNEITYSRRSYIFCYYVITVSSYSAVAVWKVGWLSIIVKF